MNALQRVDYTAMAPVLAAGLGAAAVLVADLFWPLARRAAVLWVAVAGAVAALAASLALVGAQRATFCTGPTVLAGDVRVGASCSYVVDRFTVFFLVLLSAAALVALLASLAHVRESDLPPGEYGLLLLASLTGGLTLAGARDLLTVLVGLETLTLPTYVLVGLRRRDRRSAEAAVKYLLVSVTASAVMLLGMALVYGLTGSVHLDRIAAAFDARPELRSLPVTAAAVMLVLAGFGFKIAAVPFHWWAPDVYQGAPVPVAAYLATVSKAGGLAGLLLLVLVAFPSFASLWGGALAVLAAASLLLGNLVALRQVHVVRLLAWSSVAHAGYLLVPLGVASDRRGQDMLNVAANATAGYLALYVAMNLGAFVCVTAASRRLGGAAFDDYRGLAGRAPWLAAALAFFLVCLAGLPPGLVGLVAKVVVFRAALLGGVGWLAVVMAVATVVGLGYYLRLVALLYRRPAAAPGGAPGGAVSGGAPEVGSGDGAAAVPTPAAARLPTALVAALVLTTAATVVLGFAPQLVLGAVPFTAP